MDQCQPLKPHPCDWLMPRLVERCSLENIRVFKKLDCSSFAEVKKPDFSNFAEVKNMDSRSLLEVNKKDFKRLDFKLNRNQQNSNRNETANDVDRRQFGVRLPDAGVAAHPTHEIVRKILNICNENPMRWSNDRCVVVSVRK